MENADFNAQRISREYCQTIHTTPEKVFLLLCPVREAEWLDGWQYDMIYSESGLVEEGAVFSTPYEGEEDTIWIVSKHNSDTREVEFVRFTNNSRTCLLKIAVKPKGEHDSYVEISYMYTGISSTGNDFVNEFTEDVFLEAVTFWEKSMNYFLKTGEKLKKHNHANSADAKSRAAELAALMRPAGALTAELIILRLVERPQGALTNRSNTNHALRGLRPLVRALKI